MMAYGGRDITPFILRHSMDVSVQLHSPAALPPLDNTPVLIGGCATYTVCAFWRTEKSLVPAWHRTGRTVA
jgi:hypothetical protein